MARGSPSSRSQISVTAVLSSSLTIESGRRMRYRGAAGDFFGDTQAHPRFANPGWTHQRHESVLPDELLHLANVDVSIYEARHWKGQAVPAHRFRFEPRKFVLEVGMRQLMDVLSLVEVPKPVPPHVDKACSRRETAPGQIGARGGQQCLASVADGHQPGRAIQSL